MIKKVFNYVKKYRMIEPEDVVIAGISGGADSVCLLFMLLEIRKKIPFILEVVHVNHGIREDAFKDAEFVRKLCDEKDIPFYLIEVNVKECARAQGISEEEAGRDIRYKSFEAVRLLLLITVTTELRQCYFISLEEQGLPGPVVSDL